MNKSALAHVKLRAGTITGKKKREKKKSILKLKLEVGMDEKPNIIDPRPTPEPPSLPCSLLDKILFFIQLKRKKCYVCLLESNCLLENSFLEK